MSVVESRGAAEGPATEPSTGVRLHSPHCTHATVHSSVAMVFFCPSRPLLASGDGAEERESPLVRPDAELDKMKSLLKQRDDEISIHTMCPWRSTHLSPCVSASCEW